MGLDCSLDQVVIFCNGALWLRSDFSNYVARTAPLQYVKSLITTTPRRQVATGCCLKILIFGSILGLIHHPPVRYLLAVS